MHVKLIIIQITVHMCICLYLVKLLQDKSVPALNEFGKVSLLSIILPVQQEPESRCIAEGAECPQEVARLTASSVGLVQHLEEKPKLAG